MVVHVERTSWVEVVDEETGFEISGADEWSLLRCAGCDNVRLKHQSWFSEDTDDRGRPCSSTEFFPPTIKRPKPVWRRELFPFSVALNQFNDLQDEIYSALSLGAYRLAVMGIRALVERVMVEEVGDRGTFEDTISAFFDAGYVAPIQRELFRGTLVEAGHAAMHRGFAPSEDAVNTLLDIVEGVIHSMYYAPLLAERVNKTIPQRERKGPKKPLSP